MCICAGTTLNLADKPDHLTHNVLLFFAGLQKEDLRPREEIVRDKLLQVLESAYPNVLSVEDLMRYGIVLQSQLDQTILSKIVLKPIGHTMFGYSQPNIDVTFKALHHF